MKLDDDDDDVDGNYPKNMYRGKSFATIVKRMLKVK